MQLHWISKLILVLIVFQLTAILVSSAQLIVEFRQASTTFFPDPYSTGVIAMFRTAVAGAVGWSLHVLAEVGGSIAAIAMLEIVHRAWTRLRDTGRLGPIVIRSGTK